MTLADDLAALIAAREAATKGPWGVTGGGSDEGWQFHVRLTDGSRIAQLGAGQAKDAAFIALAANVIEAHGAELAALVAENARLRAALEGFGLLCDCPPDWLMQDGSHSRECVQSMPEYKAARAALRGPS